MKSSYLKYLGTVGAILAVTPSMSFCQHYTNKALIKMLYADKDYMAKRETVVRDFRNAPAGHWGEFVKGVNEELATNSKVIAFTFDACGGGRKGNRFNADLIKLLKEEKVPATLFVSGLWIDANPETFMELAKDSLFEIENHGLNHRPCAVRGESEYGIKGTPDPADAFDEMEANAIKIEKMTGRKPAYYRSATAFVDEAGVKIAAMLGIKVVSFDILSGDAVAGTPAPVITKNVVENAEPGAIVIMHFNHPESKTLEAMRTIIPELRKQGYRFVHLDALPLKSKPSIKR